MASSSWNIVPPQNSYGCHGYRRFAPPASGWLKWSGAFKESDMDVGFIGLGKMGIAMARNLAKAGHNVRAWNRSPVEAPGLSLVKTAREAFQADIVFTMLSDDAALRAVVLDGGLLEDAPKGLVHVGCSTISIACAEELTKRHASAGVGYISAPVFGRPDVAEA